jgi:LysM repeat protein
VALTAAAALGIIALLVSGAFSGSGSRRLLRIALSVDAGMALLLLVLWVFPRLPWPVYGQKPVRARADWRQALGGLAAAGLIVATIAGGFILAYGEIGALDQSEPVENALPKASLVAVAGVVDTDIPPAPSSSPTESASTATVMAMALPTRSGTEIPTATPTAGPIAASTKTNVPPPTATASPLPTATTPPLVMVTSTPILVPTTTSMPTATQSPTATAVFTPTACVPGASGWVEHTVQRGDTLSELAEQTGTQSGLILQTNCLADDQIDVGQRILLPHMEVVADGALLASNMVITPVIDGDLSEWSVLANTADTVVYGANHWSGTSDLSATFALGWDDANLYLVVSVRDDVLAQTQTGESIFRGDSVEFLLDGALQADRQHEKLSADDYQVGLSPGDLTGATVTAQAYAWFPAGQTGPLPIAQVAASTTVYGYVLEAAVPWDALGVTPAAGSDYGFALSVSDNDLYGLVTQQSMVSTSAGRLLTDPTPWGQLRLDP